MDESKKAPSRFKLSKKQIAIITGIAVPIVVALIGIYNHDERQAMRDSNQAKKDIIHAERDVTINNNLYVDTTKKVTNQSKESKSISSKKSVKKSGTVEKNAGDTYNVTSNNQTGGVTVGKVTIIQDSDDIDPLSIADNFKIVVDTVNKFIIINPIRGKIIKTFIAVPLSEMDFVQASFTSQTGLSTMVHSFNSTISNENVYMMYTEGQPSDKYFGYGFTFKKLPSHIYYGDYSTGSFTKTVFY